MAIWSVAALASTKAWAASSTRSMSAPSSIDFEASTASTTPRSRWSSSGTAAVVSTQVAVLAHARGR